MLRLIAVFCAILLLSLSPAVSFAQDADEKIPPIPRRLPAKSDYKLSEEEQKRLKEATQKSRKALEAVEDKPLYADAAIYQKAVEFALDWDEFYGKGDIKKADTCLATAQERAQQLQEGKTPWAEQKGLVVRGYRSKIDGSVQPYGLVIPEGLDLAKPQPLYIWLHGRGDKNTDMHFIHDRTTKKGQISPDDAIVVHPFGRHCVGFKSAGEIDVLEVIEHVKSQYNIDDRRIVLMGFSMGGAGVWHIGAHYADNFVAMSPGAGFAETARYTNLKPENFPPEYEQTLWKVYDVPNYVRNLFNLPVVAYSGENDKQIQAARVMEEAYEAEGQKLTHLIGPKMGHKYAPETLEQILQILKAAREEGQPEYPQVVNLQTPTLRYGKMHWVQVLGLEEHWKDSRLGAQWRAPDDLFVGTVNINRVRFDLKQPGPVKIEIDGQKLEVPESGKSIELAKTEEGWKHRPDASTSETRRKKPGLQGPIDDAFLEPFLVVLPSGKSSHGAVQRWVEFEADHMQSRWKALFRGQVRAKLDKDVTDEDIQKYHLVCWGTPESNTVLKKTLGELPLKWNGESVELADQKLDAKHHVPVMVYPNPLNQQKYLVVNSGVTFREDHDRTNSLQNPKLPDWAVIDVRQNPDGSSPGKVVAADFFDESWQP